MRDQPITDEERARRRKEFIDRWKRNAAILQKLGFIQLSGGRTVFDRPVEVALDGRSDIAIDLREVEFESAADVIEWAHERGFQDGQNALRGGLKALLRIV